MKHILHKIGITLAFCFTTFNIDAQHLSIINLFSPLSVEKPGSSKDVIIIFKNIDTTTISAVDLSYSINGLTMPTFHWVGILSPSALGTADIGKFSIPNGGYSLCIYISASGFNDTLCYNYAGSATITPPYSENFELVNLGWAASPTPEKNTSWQLGLPNFGSTNTTHSGNKCWDVNLSTAYENNSLTYLYSPFFDFTTANNWRLTFWQNYHTEPTWDGMRVEFSNDSGNTWNTLGTLDDSIAFNWYNSNLFGTSTILGFSGNSNGWVQSIYPLSQLNNSGTKIQFRFLFISDNVVNYDGVSIDDFSIDTCSLIANSFLINNATCKGIADGQVSVNASSGSAPYSYLWDNGVTTQNNQVTSGTYSVIVSDLNGCSYRASIKVNEIQPILISLTETHNCATFINSIITSVSGGLSSSYSYLWDSGLTQPDYLFSSAGLYTVTVTDANGCSATSDINVVANATYNIEAKNPTCAGDTGLLIANFYGTPPYNYLWSDGSTNKTLSALAGVYTCTMTDTLGCTGTYQQILSDPIPLVFGSNVITYLCNDQFTSISQSVTGPGNLDYLWSNGSSTNDIVTNSPGIYTLTVTNSMGCAIQTSLSIPIHQPMSASNLNNFDCTTNIGSSTLNVTGGVLPVSYLWSNGATVNSLNNVTAGTYNVTIIDNVGCGLFLPVDIASVFSIDIQGTNPTCFGNSDGAATANALIGGPIVNYLWNTGAITQTISGLTAGIYICSATDLTGCTTIDTISIQNPPPINIIPYETFNCLTGIDSVYITSTGGNPPFIYNWSNSSTTFYLTNPAPGIYTVIVTDINGCSGTSSVTVTGSLNLSLTKTNPDCYGYPGAMSAAMNGVPPLAYFWSNGVTVPQLINPPAGTYTVTVTDVNGCSLSATDSIVEPEQIVLTLDSVIAAGCGVNDGSFYYSYTPPGFSIPNINGNPFATPINLAAGIYDMYLLQNTCMSNVIHVVVPDSCEDVWPGDANYDLVADNKDLLQIGLAYGNTGPIRTSASSAWVAQPATDWSNWFNIGVNQKHADCDGNGVIDAADTIPILANYGLTHLLKPANILQVNTLAPDLYLTISNDTTGLSDSVFVNVMCGTAANPVDSIYGLAFRLYYDSALVDTASISFNSSTTFLGTNGVNLISITKNFGAGYADFAITRTDHLNASGHGPITVMGIVTTDNVAGKLTNAVNTVLQFSLGNVYAITANEFPITLDAFGDSIYVDSNLTAINYLNWDAAIKVFPNPANGYLIVESTHTEISKITIINQLGEMVYLNNNPALPQLINTAAFSKGIYVLRIETKKGVIHRKLQVMR